MKHCFPKFITKFQGFVFELRFIDSGLNFYSSSYFLKKKKLCFSIEQMLLIQKDKLGVKMLNDKKVIKENVRKIRRLVVKMLKFKLPINQKGI